MPIHIHFALFQKIYLLTLTEHFPAIDRFWGQAFTGIHFYSTSKESKAKTKIIRKRYEHVFSHINLKSVALQKFYDVFYDETSLKIIS